MRVASKTMYGQMGLRLNDLSYNLKQANEVVSTGNRINRISDDPIGLSQVLNMRSSLNNLDQLKRNLYMGKTWCTAVETSLTSISDLITETKLLTLQLSNDSVNATQRRDAMSVIEGRIDQIMTLANSDVDGRYIFAGSDIDARPMQFDSAENPAKVEYHGDESAYAIKSDKNTDVAVGKVGSDVFWNQTIKVDTTNSRIDFKEYDRTGGDGLKLSNISTGGGINSTDTDITVNNFDALSYSTPYPAASAPLKFRWDGNGSWDVFNDPGYNLPASIQGTESKLEIDLDEDTKPDVTIKLDTPVSASGGYVEFDISPNERILTGYVPEGTYSKADLASQIESAMNDASEYSGYDVDYVVSYNSTDGTFKIGNDGAYQDAFSGNGFLGFQFISNPGEGSGIPKVRNLNTGEGIDIQDATVTVVSNENLTIGTPYPLGSAPMRLTWDGASKWTVLNNPGYPIPSSIDGFANKIELDMGGDSSPDLIINLDKDAVEGSFVEFDIIPDLGKHSIGADIGIGEVMTFNPLTSDNDISPITSVIIDNNNNRIDFQEFDVTGATKGPLLATIPSQEYTDAASLASAVETALNTKSELSGMNITYSVSYSSDDSKFVIKGNGNNLGETRMLWNSGENTTTSAGATLGFDVAYDAEGKFGGDLLASGWDVGDTVNASFTIGGNTLNYNRAILATDTNSVILNDIQTQLAATFPTEGTFTLNGNYIEFTLDNKSLRINGVSDTAANDAVLEVATSNASTTTPQSTTSIGNGDDVRIFAPSDEVTRIPVSDNEVSLITINEANNRLDFEEFDTTVPTPVGSGEISITIPDGEYKTTTDLENAVTAAMNAASINGANYIVTYNDESNKFTIEEDSGNLSTFDLGWYSGTNTASSIATTLGYHKTDFASGKFGFASGDLNSMNWFEDNDITLSFTDGVNTLDYARTIDTQSVSGNFGFDGEKMDQANWHDGDTVSMRFSDGVNELYYSRTIDLNAGDTTEDILSDMQTQLTAAFGTDATFTTNNITRNIDFELNVKGREFSVDEFTDSGANEPAFMSINGTTDTVVHPLGNTQGTIASNQQSRLTLVDATGEDTVDSVLEDMHTQLEATFGTDITFNIDSTTKDIEFTLTQYNRKFKISNFTDSGTHEAKLVAEINAGTVYDPQAVADPATPTITGMVANKTGTVNMVAPSDDIGALTYTAEEDTVLFSIDDSNSKIDFVEINSANERTVELAATIASGDYTNIADFSKAIETALETASQNSVDYNVQYDKNLRKFIVKEAGTSLNEFRLLWDTGENKESSAAQVMGFDQTDDIMSFPKSENYVVHISVDDSNNKIDFKEVVDGQSASTVLELTAEIQPGNYTTYEELAAAVETALDNESTAKGHGIDYKVTYDYASKRMTIKEKGTKLDDLQILWSTGENGPTLEGGTGENAGSILGFDAKDDSASVMESTEKVEWGLFNTLFAMKEFLNENDVEGLARTITRLDSNFQSIESTISDTGIKYNRLDIKEKIIVDLNLSINDRKINIEEADIVKAVMDLKNTEMAYQAALNATAKILSTTLADYL